jgi:hypothetical protein
LRRTERRTRDDRGDYTGRNSVPGEQTFTPAALFISFTCDFVRRSALFAVLLFSSEHQRGRRWPSILQPIFQASRLLSHALPTLPCSVSCCSSRMRLRLLTVWISFLIDLFTEHARAVRRAPGDRAGSPSNPFCLSRLPCLLLSLPLPALSRAAGHVRLYLPGQVEAPNAAFPQLQISSEQPPSHSDARPISKCADEFCLPDSAAPQPVQESMPSPTYTLQQVQSQFCFVSQTCVCFCHPSTVLTVFCCFSLTVPCRTSLPR